MDICLATEDILSEAVAEKLLAATGGAFVIGMKLGNQGFGYLKSRLPSFNQQAQHVMPVLLLTDLDNANCVVTFMADWKRGVTLSDRLLFRVVVHEIEAWLLADQQAFATWADVSLALLPEQPESLVDPKQHLLNLIKRSKQRELKENVLPAKNSHSPVGLGYNAYLIRYVREHWNPLTAAASAPSLARTLKRLQELAS